MSEVSAPYADYYVAQKCVQFSTSFAATLVAGKLRHCLLMHLFFLWDLGLVEADVVDQCIQIYDKQEQATAPVQPASAGGGAQPAPSDRIEGAGAAAAAAAGAAAAPTPMAVAAAGPGVSTV